MLVFFSVLFSIVISSLWDERAGLYASRVFVCLSRMHYFLSFSLPRGVRAWLWYFLNFSSFRRTQQKLDLAELLSICQL